MKADKTKSRELEKTPPLKKWIWFSELNDKTNLVNQRQFCICSLALPANGLRYLRWGGDGEAVQPEKG